LVSLSLGKCGRILMSDDKRNYIKALEKSILEDIEDLKKMQEENTKFGDMQPIKESIFRKRRTIAKIEQDIKNGK
jgi:uncharacterized protein (UPF0305 family)